MIGEESKGIKMGIDDLFDDGLLKGLIRVFVGLLRFLHFLGWHCLIDGIGWRIGWGFYRLITFGGWPKEGLSDHEAAGFGTLLVVDLTGLGLLAGLIAWLGQFA